MVMTPMRIVEAINRAFATLADPEQREHWPVARDGLVYLIGNLHDVTEIILADIHVDEEGKVSLRMPEEEDAA